MNRLSAASLAFLLVLGASRPAAAQLPIEVGIRGGVSVASVSADLDTFDSDNRTGFVGGPFMDLGLGTFGVQVAGLYHQLGFESDDFDLKLSYYEVPVVLKVGLPLVLLKPSVFGGVTLGFEGSCEINGVDCSGDDTSGTQYGGVAGADLAVYLGAFSLWLDGRYNFGLSDVNDASDVFDELGDFQNRSWDITVGVGVGL